MRVRLAVVLTLVAAALAVVSAQTDATGRWNMTVSTDQGSLPTTLTLQQDGEALSGSMASDQGTVEFDGTDVSATEATHRDARHHRTRFTALRMRTVAPVGPGTEPLTSSNSRS